MVKKAKRARTSNKMKKGTKVTCESCGMVLSVVDPCRCDPCDLLCCGDNMKVKVC